MTGLNAISPWHFQTYHWQFPLPDPSCMKYKTFSSDSFSFVWLYTPLWCGHVQKKAHNISHTSSHTIHSGDGTWIISILFRCSGKDQATSRRWQFLVMGTHKGCYLNYSSHYHPGVPIGLPDVSVTEPDMVCSSVPCIVHRLHVNPPCGWDN